MNRLPNCLEAEKGVLGAVLVDEKLAPIVLESLEKEDFFSDKNKDVFEAIKCLYEKKEPIDEITVGNYLKTKKNWNGESFSYLLDIENALPIASHVHKYCEIVKSKAVARKFMFLSHDSQKEVSNGAEVEEVLEKFKESILQIERTKNGKVVNPASFELYFKLIKERRNGKRTGYSELDKWIDFNPSELNIVAGRTGHGKTFFLLNLLLNMYEKNQDEPFLFFSFEMDYEQIFGRILGILSRKYGMKEIRKCYREGELYPEILKAQKKFEEYEKNKNFFIIYEPDLTVTEIRKYCLNIKEKFGKLGCVFIDYLQKVKVNEKFPTRQLEIAYITDKLRTISQELEVPIIAGAQIGRSAVRETKDKRPRLEDLREAGDIEQDATVVLGLYNKVVQEKENNEKEEEESSKKVDLEVWILKNRHGVPNKKVELEFDMNSGFVKESLNSSVFKDLKKTYFQKSYGNK